MSDELVLYGNEGWTSPYVFSAFVALREKGLPFTVQLVSLEKQEHQRPDYRDRSITGRVPALRHGDFWLAESSAIDEYLEETFPPPRHPRLYPADPRARARVRMVQALVRSDFMPVRAERSTSQLFLGEKPRPLSKEARAAAERLCRIAAALVPSAEAHVAGPFTMADADLSLALMRLVNAGDPVPPHLAAWARRIWERPSIRTWLANTRYAGDGAVRAGGGASSRSARPRRAAPARARRPRASSRAARRTPARKR
jgi:glutathione S-transferase